MKSKDLSSFEFFSMVQDLERRFGPSIFSSVAQNVRIAPSTDFGFQPADVLVGEKQENGQVVIRVGFLGILGCSSPLPSHITEPMAQDRESYKGMKFLLELMNHRLYALYYLAYKKFRPWMNLTGAPNAASAFPVPQKKSSRALALACKAYFQLSHVSIFPFASKRVLLPKPAKLGKEGALLGVDALIGETAEIGGQHFRVDVSGVEPSQFLPLVRGDLTWVNEMADFIRKSLPMPLDFTIRLEQKMREASLDNQTRLSHTILGADSWLGLQPSEYLSKEFYFCG